MKSEPMRIFFSLVIISFITIAACNGDTNNGAPTIDGVFQYLESSDSTLCDPDGILPGECGGGTIWLTKNGNVLYNGHCTEKLKETYSIGKYVVSESMITCTFDKDYTYTLSKCHGHANCNDANPPDPNAGKLTTTMPWTLKLVKSKCDAFAYGVFLNETEKLQNKQDREKPNYDANIMQTQGHVLIKFFDEDAKQYTDSLSKIKILSEF